MWRGPLLLLLMISRAAALRDQQVTSVTDEVDEVCGQECHLINPAGENYYVGFREVEGSPEELKAGSQYDLRTSPCGETSDEPPRKITIAPTGEKDRHGLVKGELQRKLEWSLNHIEKLQDGEIRICTSGEQPRCICKLDASFLETKEDTEHFLWACLPLAAFACGVGFFSGILYAAYRLKDGSLKNPSKDCGKDDERSVCVVSHGLDDDTKDRSLKNPSKEHRSSPSTTSKSPALSIRQIRDRWLWAFGSCLVALSCGTPFLGILTTGAMFWLYSCRQTHRLFLVEAPQRIPLHVQVLTEGILWTSLFQACIYTIVTYTKRYLRLFASDTSNIKVVTQDILAEAEVGVIVVACTFGSTILWRVLLINAMEIAQNVHEHRQRVTLPPKAREIWKQLQDKFDKYFPKKEPPATFTELRLRQDSKDKIEKDIFGEVDLYSIDKALIFTSTLVLGVSLIVLQCQLDWTASHEERVPGYLAWRRRGMGRYLYAGLGGVITAYVAAHHWFRLTSATVGVTRSFKQLPQRMLLFSFLATTSNQVEIKGDESREALEDMRTYMKAQVANLKEKDADRRRQLEESLEKDPNLDLQTVLYLFIGEKQKLNLGDREDIHAWAQLRDFINLDFLDASAIMECAGTVIVLQIVNFAFAGMVVWFREGRNFVVAFSLWLVLLLSLLLMKLLFRVLLVCVRANLMLHRDARRLMDVQVAQLQERRGQKEADIEKIEEMTALGQKETDIEKIKEMTDRTLTGTFIHAVQRQAEASEYMQKLFGIEVTVTMLQGWTISLAVLFLQALWSLGGQHLVNLDPAKLAAELICWRKTGEGCNMTRTFDH